MHGGLIRTLVPALIFGCLFCLFGFIAGTQIHQSWERRRIAQVRVDLRAMSVAVESYYVDNMTYPPFTRGGPLSVDPPAAEPFRNATFVRRVNPDSVPHGSHVPVVSSLTTPVAYLSSFPTDPFSGAGGAYRYFSVMGGWGWILGSFGPDRDESSGGDLAWNLGVSSSWDGRTTSTEYRWSQLTEPLTTTTLSASAEAELRKGIQVEGLDALLWAVRQGTDPIPWLVEPNPATGESRTYDPTNGLVSPGDLWRIRD
jgi:hypothetical protein